MNTQYLFTKDHPIFRNHKVYGQALLPGMAYIDFLFQLFASRGYDIRRLELRNLSLFQPLIVGEDFDVLIDIRCKIERIGAWKITVTGAKSRQGVVASESVQYAAAEMIEGEPAKFEHTLDPAAWEADARTVRDLDDIYAWAEQRELVHRGLMRASGKVYDHPDGVLVDLTLADTEVPPRSFLFHPTLIDASGVGSAPLFFEQLDGEDRLFLPLHIGSFRATQKIQDRCLTLIQRSEVRLEKELMHQTWRFFDAQGRQVAEMTNFVNKLVRNAGLIAPERATQPLAQPSPTVAAQPQESAYPKATHYLRTLLAQTLDKPLDQVLPDSGYYELGLSSSELLGVVEAIGRELKTSLSPILLFEYTNITELAAHLAQSWPDHFGEGPAAGPCDERVDTDESFAPQTNESLAPPATAQDSSGDVAVIGMAGRYPMAPNLRVFWDNLKAGQDCITQIPADRWDIADLDGITTPSGKPICPFGGFLQDVDCFDPLFFGVSPRHAEIIDPQERLFMETCWEALEDAGHTPATLVPERGPHKRRAVAVFVGVMHKDYSLVGQSGLSRDNLYPLSLNCAQIANRVSYSFNFHGPSMAVDTACSSSLTAVHLALQSLNSGEAEAALAGGVNLSLFPAKYVSYGLADMHATDGRCRSFGEGGDGYVPAEGVGALLLKPLQAAVADGDRIDAVIKGSAVNHVGAVSGISVPSPIAQSEMILDCLDRTGINPRTLSVIEAHGTGTALGDPIEMQGLVRAFSRHTADTQFCAIGSVKSNIGHAEAAAGVSALTKIVLMLKHRTLVPSLHADRLNPLIKFQSSPFYLQRRTQPWTRLSDDVPRRAGVSSFGAGGANAYVILEEYTAQTSSPNAHGPVMVVLSAADQTRLKAYAERLHDFVTDALKAEGTDQPVLDRLQKLTARLLDMEPADIDPNVALADLGLDRVQQDQLAEHIRERFQMPFDPAALQELETLTQIAETLPEAQPSQNQLLNPVDLAFTLQVGRRPMAARLGLSTTSMADLAHKLQRFLKGDTHIPELFTGVVPRNNGVLAVTVPNQDQRAQFTAQAGRGEVAPLLEAWVKGTNWVWRDLYTANPPRPISLPTYPFARERYWSAGDTPTTAGAHPYRRNAQPVPELARPRIPTDDTLYFTEVETALPNAWNLDWTQALHAAAGRRLLLITREVSACTPLVQLLQQLTQSAKLQPFQIQTITLEALQAEVQIETPDDVLYLDAATLDPLPAVFALSQALMRNAWGQDINLFLLYPGAVSAQRPAFRALSGFLRSAQKENPQHVWTLIEHHQPRVSPAQALLRAWLGTHRTGQFQHLRYTGDGVHRFDLAEIHPQTPAKTVFKTGGTYVITGGLGPVGDLLCRELAMRYRANLVILSRGTLDAAKQAQVAQIQALGAAVAYHALDIADLTALDAALTKARAQFGPLHGVVHLARLVEDAPIISKTAEGINRVIHAKVAGTVALDQATAQDPLDVFMLYASVGAYGTRGSADYAYAAAFQNAFAAHRQTLVQAGSRAGQSLSLVWGAWSVDRYQPKNRDANMAATGMGFITIDHAFPMMDNAASSGLPVCGALAVGDAAVVRQGFGLTPPQPDAKPTQTPFNPQMVAQWEARKARGETLAVAELHHMLDETQLATLPDDQINRLYALFFEREPQAPPPVAQAPVSSPDQAETGLTRIVMETLSEVLKLTDIDEHQSFQNYGLDSISGMQLSTRLEKRLNREVQPQWFLEFATVQSLTEHLQTVLADSTQRSAP